MAKNAENTENEVKNVNVGIDMATLKELLKAEILKEMAAEKEKEQDAPAPVKKREKDAYLNEYVEVQLFKDGKDYKDDVSVHVNGENCVIKRGVPVKIKRKFAIVLEQSAQQNIKAAEFADEKAQQFKDELKKYNY